MSCCGRIWFALALTALTPGAVAAQEEAPAESPSDAAAAAFAEGMSALDELRVAEALEHFRRALELDPRDAVHFNIAFCLERLGRYREAAEEYAVAEGSEELDDEVRRRAAERREASRARLGTLRVTGWPGAQLLVDGEPRCTLPCELEDDARSLALGVEEGEHRWTGTAELRTGELTDVTVPPRARPSVIAPTTVEPTSPDGAPSVQLGWLTAVGGGLAALGTGGTIGFGVHAQSLHDAFDRNPTEALAEEGELFRDLTNASIVLIGVGVTLFVVDLFVSTGR